MKISAKIIILLFLLSLLFLALYFKSYFVKNNIITNKIEEQKVSSSITPTFNTKLWPTIDSLTRKKIIFPEQCE